MNDTLGSGGTASLTAGTLVNPVTIQKFQTSDVAVKIFQEKQGSKNVNENFRYEIAIMSLLQKVQNVCKFIGYMEQPFQAIVMKRYQSSVLEYARNRDLTTQPYLMLQLAWQVANGMKSIHGLNILHLDLKPGNILWEETEGVISFVVSDFGCANIIGNKRDVVSGLEVPREVGVSIRYAAPEVFQHLASMNFTGRNERIKNELFKSVDVYAYGLSMYHLMRPKAPVFWPQLAQTDVMEKVLRGERPEISEIPTTLLNHPDTCKLIPIIKRSWSHIPEDRPTFEDILGQLTMNWQ